MTIGYNYWFNYFGGEVFERKTIVGASIDVAIKIYKYGKIIDFDENSGEEASYGKYLSDVFKVSVDRQTAYRIEKNIYVDNLFRLDKDYDKIEFEVTGYYLEGDAGNAVKVTEDVFRKFILDHISDFDISDNKNAQCLSYFYL